MRALLGTLLLAIVAATVIPPSGTTTTPAFGYDAQALWPADHLPPLDEADHRANDGSEADPALAGYGYDPHANLVRTNARPERAGSAPRAADAATDIVRYDRQWASRQLASQNLPGSTGWATTPGGRTLTARAAERTFVGGPGRAPIDPGLIDDILTLGTRTAYRGGNDTIKIFAPHVCGRCYVVVDAQNVNHIVTVMVPK